MDSTRSGRAILGALEYGSRIADSADPVARYPLPATLTWTNTHPHALNKEKEIPAPFAIVVLIIRPKETESAPTRP